MSPLGSFTMPSGAPASHGLVKDIKVHTCLLSSRDVHAVVDKFDIIVILCPPLLNHSVLLHSL